jgi:hypothetical protein
MQFSLFVTKVSFSSSHSSKDRLGLEEIFVTRTYRTGGVSLYNLLQEATIEMLLEVHLDN